MKGRSQKQGTAWWRAERRRERLVEMRDAGMTYERIAAALGTTKSACIGQANKLGMCKPAGSKGDVEQSDQKPAFPPQPTGNQCRWPLWDKAITHEYCLASVAIHGLAYCHEHAKRAYQNAPLRRL